MNRKKKIDKLMKSFNEEKKFIIDGYYRIRTINNNTIELAYLVAGACGESIVHPQITVYFEGEEVVGIKLIDMHSSPQLFLQRDDETARKIDKELDILIDRFLMKI